jgi:hypothetical protein
MSTFTIYPYLLPEMRAEFIAGMVAAIPDDYAWRLTLEMLRRVDRAHASLPQLMFLDRLALDKKAARAIRAYPALYGELWCRRLPTSPRMMALGVELDFFDLRHPAYWTGTQEDKREIFKGLQTWKCTKVLLAHADDETCKRFIPDLDDSPPGSTRVGSLKMQYIMDSGRTALISQLRKKFDSSAEALSEFDSWMRRLEARSTAATKAQDYLHNIAQNPRIFIAEFQAALRTKNAELAMEILATGACPANVSLWDLQGASQKIDRMALLVAMEKALQRNIELETASHIHRLQYTVDRRSILFFYDVCATRNYRGEKDFTLVTLIWQHSDLLPRFKALPQNFPLGDDFMKRAITHNTGIALQFGIAQGLKMTLDLFQHAFMCNAVHNLYWLTTRGFTFDKDAMVAFLLNRKDPLWIPTPKMLAYMKYIKMELP